MQVDGNHIQMMKHVIKKRGWIQFPSRGDSMYPLIREGNLCTFQSFDPLDLKKGDIILFVSNTGTLIGHRFYASFYHQNQMMFIFKGDSNLKDDELISAEQMIGKLVRIEGSHMLIDPHRWVFRCWGKIVIHVPLISRVLRGYLRMRKNKEAYHSCSYP